jgi:hypothetical protein
MIKFNNNHDNNIKGKLAVQWISKWDELSEFMAYDLKLNIWGVYFNEIKITECVDDLFLR